MIRLRHKQKENTLLQPAFEKHISTTYTGRLVYLKRQTCAKHQHKYEFKVLVNRPQQFHCPISIIHKEVQRSRAENRVGEENA